MRTARARVHDHYGSLLKSLGLWFMVICALLINAGLAISLSGLDNSPSWWSPLLLGVLLLACSGSLFTLLISGVIARFIVGVRPITAPASYLERWLLSTVEKQSKQMDISPPRVGIFYSSDMNAFTTGWGQKHALLAVSTGLLENLTHDELEAVIGHELAHIENGDMVAMALVQGIALVFVHLPCWLAHTLVDRLLLRGRAYDIAQHLVRLVMLLTVALLPSLIINWFSRYREYSADASSALLHGPERMIAALESLKRGIQYSMLPENLASLGISGEEPAGVWRFLMSHPSLVQRIGALQQHC